MSAVMIVMGEGASLMLSLWLDAVVMVLVTPPLSWLMRSWKRGGSPTAL